MFFDVLPHLFRNGNLPVDILALYHVIVGTALLAKFLWNDLVIVVLWSTFLSAYITITCQKRSKWLLVHVVDLAIGNKWIMHFYLVNVFCKTFFLMIFIPGSTQGTFYFDFAYDFCCWLCASVCFCFSFSLWEVKPRQSCKDKRCMCEWPAFFFYWHSCNLLNILC